MTAWYRRDVVLNGVLLAFALLTRIAQYVHNRSLWLDELALGLNIKQRDFAGLLQPLDYAQGAPLPFLWATEALTQLAGHSEFVLRFIPLVASCLAIILTWQLCRRIAPQAAPLLLIFLATSSSLIYYAAEFKQYAVDTAVAPLLLLLALRLHERGYQRKDMLLVGIVGALAVWVSHPALFVAAGIGVTLFIMALRQGQRNRALALSGLGAVWLGSFALAYVLVYQPLTVNQDLMGYWQGEFVQIDLASFLRAFFELFSYVAGFFNPGLLIVCITGFVLAWRRLPLWQVALLTMPTVFALLASILQKYPFSGRLILFLLPAFILLTAVGLTTALNALWRANRWVGGGLLALLVVALLTRAEYIQDKAEYRAVIEHIQLDQPTPPIYTFSIGILAAEFYEVPVQQATTISAITEPTWLFFAPYDEDEANRVLAQWDALGVREATYEVRGAAGYRYVPR